MLSISTVREALTYLSNETGRAWSESELFDFVTKLNLRLSASLPSKVTSAVMHFTDDYRFVEKFRCEDPLLALLYTHDVARVWLSGECLARHVEDNRLAEGEMNLLITPIPVTRDGVRIRLSVIDEILRAWRDAQAGKNQHRVPAFARPLPPFAFHADPAPADDSPAPANEKQSATPADDAELSKRERQIRAIEEAASENGYDALRIPTGGKSLLRKQCQRLHPSLFGAGPDPFNDAWKEALACNPPRLRMADHHKFRGK